MTLKTTHYGKKNVGIAHKKVFYSKITLNSRAVYVLEKWIKTTQRTLRPIPNVVLPPCRTQMNLARQWHYKSTAVVSNVEFNSVASRAESRQIQIKSEKTK